jgi:hypothetical protein
MVEVTIIRINLMMLNSVVAIPLCVSTASNNHINRCLTPLKIFHSISKIDVSVLMDHHQICVQKLGRVNFYTLYILKYNISYRSTQFY